AIQLVLAVVFVATLPMWTKKSTPGTSETNKLLTDYKTSLGETLRQPAVWLSLLLFFFYTGSEATLGTWAFSLLTGSRGVPAQLAGFWTSGYWASFTIGRIIAGLYAKRIGVNKLILGSLGGALLGATFIWWNPSMTVSLAGVALIGFAIAPIFPGLVSGTNQRVGDRFAANTIGMQMSAGSLGISIIPSLIGVLARNTSLEVIPICLFALFSILITLYFTGLQLRKRRELKAAAELQKGTVNAGTAL
ncbi:MFS transporter, partial [bacterium]|nr:MFS transporter [bacterium]